MAIKTGDPELITESDNYRSKALKSMRQGLTFDIIKDINSGDIYLSSSLFLSWDILYQKNSDPSDFVGFVKGLTAILQQMENVEPKATTIAKWTSSSLFQSFKSIYFPAYEPLFLDELILKVKSIQSFIESSNDILLITEHDHLVCYLMKILNFLTTTFPRTDTATMYSPYILYTYLQQWLSKFPSRAINIDNKKNQYTAQEKILYLYYHTVSKVLDAIFPDARYLFMIGFTGPVSLIEYDEDYFKNVIPTKNLLISKDYFKFIDYPSKLFKFFTKRIQILNKALVNFNPFIEEFHCQKKSRRLNSNIKETSIRFFDNLTELDLNDCLPIILNNQFDNKLKSQKNYSEVLDAEALKKYYLDRMTILGDDYYMNYYPSTISSSSNNGDDISSQSSRNSSTSSSSITLSTTSLDSSSCGSVKSFTNDLNNEITNVPFDHDNINSNSDYDYDYENNSNSAAAELDDIHLISIFCSPPSISNPLTSLNYENSFI